MRRQEWLLAAIGVALLAVGAQLVRTSRGPARDILLSDACRSPIRILEPRTRRPLGSAVVLHGLAANGRLMQTFGQSLAGAGLRVFLVDLPGHGDSTEPFSLGHTEQCAGAVVELLARRDQITLDRTVLVGHSMGAGVAVRLADRFPSAATIALSPAPMNLPRRMPGNLLIVYAQLDPGPVKEAARRLLRAAGDERLEPDDFWQRRAVKMEFVPWASHVSLLFDPRVERWTCAWAHNALDEKTQESFPVRGSPFLGGIMGVAGLLLMFPLAGRGFTAICRAGASEATSAPSGAIRLLGLWVVAALFSVGVLNLWVPLRPLRMLTGDYLGAFHSLAGVALLAVLWKERKGELRFGFRATAAACLFGLAGVLALGAWLNWQLTDGWMNLARWARFGPLVLACLPYFVAEEMALGPPVPDRHWRRFGLFLAMRIVLWLALVFALFAFGSQQLLVLLLAIYLLALTLVQRWGADVIRRRTGSPGAAAVVSAIVLAWFIAAVFPLT